MAAKYYTPETANRALPLVRAIARDVRETALELEAQYARVDRCAPGPLLTRTEERMHQVRDRLAGLLTELHQLGVELKDPFQGLLDFRAERDGREVFLCWRLGEASVGHWHDLEAGFAGRQPIETF